MPKVTLLRDEWDTRTMIFGRKKLVFQGQKPQAVSAAVALVLAKRKDEYGKPLFQVSEMPTIVKGERPPVTIPAPVPGPTHLLTQNETRSPRQRKLAECRL